VVGRRRRDQDHFGRRAKREGFAARSIYKLDEIDRRVQLVRRGDHVLDLGAAPGSWCQYAAERVGPSGRVVGMDAQEITIAMPRHVDTRVVDVLDAPLEAFGPPASFDVVVSDMAPATTGHRHLDQVRSHGLFMRAVEIALHVLRPHGRFAGKIFQSGDFLEAKEAVRTAFATTRIIRPTAVRRESYEIYVVGLDRLPLLEPPP
jgi:23S rRNA (uridine2552-2'-O)-methyltransferase